MPRPTIRLLGAVLLGFVLYSYGATSEVAWLFLLAYWTWAMAAVAAAYEAWNRRGLLAGVEVRATVPSAESPLGWLPDAVIRTAPAANPLFEGDSATVRASIASARGSRGPARLRGRVAGVELAAGFGRITEQGVGEERSLTALRRGVLGASDLAVEAADPLGLFRDRGALPDRELALVYPTFAPLGSPPRQRELEAAVAAPRAGVGTELFGVREYQAGDPLRRIHWRLSARRGELIVREYEPPGLRTMLLVLDPDPGLAADLIARLAASEAWECLQAGGRVIAWAPGLEPSGAERSIWPVLDWLARYPGAPRADEDVPRGLAEAVAITTAPGLGALTALDEVRRRGVAARAWSVGAGELDTDLPVRRAETAWPD
jgi:uncharacterized protein (DUF58 family)